MNDQLGQIFGGPTGFELGNGVDLVFSWNDADNEAIFDEFLRDGESFTLMTGASEEETAAPSS